jgi:adenylosuccinate lyase
LDLNRDIWGYIALNYFSKKSTKDEIGSSVMPHKINPIEFENAEGNLGIANALLDHFANKLPISRWQRDLSDSTVMRNLGVAFAHLLIALISTLNGLQKIEVNKKALASDLDQHWEILAEAVQTVMRSYGVANSYEKLKELTHGKNVSKEQFLIYINSLLLSNDEKKSLLNLTPEKYTGIADYLAKKLAGKLNNML